MTSNVKKLLNVEIMYFLLFEGGTFIPFVKVKRKLYLILVGHENKISSVSDKN